MKLIGQIKIDVIFQIIFEKRLFKWSFCFYAENVDSGAAEVTEICFTK